MGTLLENEHEFNSEENLSTVRRPMNAFFIFCKHHRDVVREKYPHLENRSITKILGEWWANLDPSEKSSYTALAKQYKEAFMKAHPDFKWYKLPTPPARTLITRPTNRASHQNEKIPENCGITVGKLVDNEQLGGLSSLINSSTVGEVSLPLDNYLSPPLTYFSPPQKGMETSTKPPKKRYLINGEFQLHSDPSPDDEQDSQMASACSTLLEFAEICTSSAIRENAIPVLNSTEAISPLMSCNLTQTSRNEASFSANSYNSLLNLDTQKSEGQFQNLECAPQNLSLQNNGGFKIIKRSLTQEQPLDLCKNKEKDANCVSSKTITTSHQQLIEHFVDKFLCAKPVPSNYKSEFFDPVLSKLFSNNANEASSSESNIEHSFTLSVAIESAVDKAYSLDSSKSSSKKSSDNFISFLNQASYETDYQAKKDDKNVVTYDLEKFKPAEQNNVTLASISNYKEEKVSDSVPLHKSYALSTSSPCDLSKDESADINVSKSSNVGNSNSSKYFCKLVSPPKKSSVWCNLFMNEQLTKTDVKSPSNISNNTLSGFQSPTRRSSQRTCKGRRYQALITEGLLQSSKERKQNNNKKSLASNSKIKTKVETIIENHIFPSKKKRKKDSISKCKSSKVESESKDESLFNLEEKIASLPKCSFEHLNKKKKFILEENFNVEKTKNMNTQFSSTLTCVPSSEVSEWSSVSPNGKYISGNFDLEKQIASLPKCDIEILSKKRKKDQESNG